MEIKKYPDIVVGVVVGRVRVEVVAALLAGVPGVEVGGRGWHHGSGSAESRELTGIGDLVADFALSVTFFSTRELTALGDGLAAAPKLSPLMTLN